MVAVKFPRSTGQTGVRLKWGVEGKDALHLGSTKMEGVGHSPSSLGCQGGKTGKGGGSWGGGGGGRGVGHYLDNRDIHKGKTGSGGSGDLLLYRWASALPGSGSQVTHLHSA